MMKALLAAVSLMTLSTAALAETATPPGTGPVELNDAQMDQVTAGGGGKTGFTIETRHPGRKTDDPVTAGGGKPFLGVGLDV